MIQVVGKQDAHLLVVASISSNVLQRALYGTLYSSLDKKASRVLSNTHESPFFH